MMLEGTNLVLLFCMKRLFDAVSAFYINTDEDTQSCITAKYPTLEKLEKPRVFSISKKTV